jgi:cyanate permease
MTERWVDRVPDAPGGVYGAWINVIMCGAIGVGGAVSIFTSVAQPAGTLFALAFLALGAFLEWVFIHKLRQEIAIRRISRRRARGELTDQADPDD